MNPWHDRASAAADRSNSPSTSKKALPDFAGAFSSCAPFPSKSCPSRWASLDPRRASFRFSLQSYALCMRAPHVNDRYLANLLRPQVDVVLGLKHGAGIKGVDWPAVQPCQIDDEELIAAAAAADGALEDEMFLHLPQQRTEYLMDRWRYQGNPSALCCTPDGELFLFARGVRGNVLSAVSRGAPREPMTLLQFDNRVTIIDANASVLVAASGDSVAILALNRDHPEASQSVFEMSVRAFPAPGDHVHSDTCFIVDAVVPPDSFGRRARGEALVQLSCGLCTVVNLAARQVQVMHVLDSSAGPRCSFRYLGHGRRFLVAAADQALLLDLTLCSPEPQLLYELWQSPVRKAEVSRAPLFCASVCPLVPTLVALAVADRLVLLDATFPGQPLLTLALAPSRPGIGPVAMSWNGSSRLVLAWANGQLAQVSFIASEQGDGLMLLGPARYRHSFVKLLAAPRVAAFAGLCHDSRGRLYVGSSLLGAFMQQNFGEPASNYPQAVLYALYQLMVPQQEKVDAGDAKKAPKKLKDQLGGQELGEWEPDWSMLDRLMEEDPPIRVPDVDQVQEIKASFYDPVQPNRPQL